MCIRDSPTDAAGIVASVQTFPSSPPPPVPTTGKPSAESPSETFSSLSLSSRSALNRQNMGRPQVFHCLGCNRVSIASCSNCRASWCQDCMRQCPLC
eukprot:12391288-Prorocentrum_lima.AAC.1